MTSFLNPSAAIAAAHISPGSHIADLAAGSGFFARAAARATGPDGLVWAVDAHGDMLARLKNLAQGEGLHNVEVVRGSFERHKGTHLQDASLDMAILANALFSAVDREVAAAEACRVLRKAGRLLLIDWTGSHGGLGPHEGHIITAAQARRVFEPAGFAWEEDIPAGAYHWGLILRKK